MTSNTRYMMRETFYGAVALRDLRAAFVYWPNGQYAWASLALRNSLCAQARMSGHDEFAKWACHWLDLPWAGYFPIGHKPTTPLAGQGVEL